MKAIDRFTKETGINATLEGGWTMLHVAVRANRLDIVKSLLKSHADTNRTTKNSGCSPLFLAKNIDMVEALVLGGAHLSQSDLAGETAIRVSGLLQALCAKDTFSEMKSHLQIHRRQADEINVAPGMKKLFDAIADSLTPEEACKKFNGSSPNRKFGR